MNKHRARHIFAETDICRKEAGILPLWSIDPDDILATPIGYDPSNQGNILKNEIYSSCLNRVMDASSPCSIRACAVTLQSPLSNSMENNLLMTCGGRSIIHSSSSPDLFQLREHHEYFENMKKSTHWEQIAPLSMVKRSNSLESLAIKNVKESIKGEIVLLDKFRSAIEKTLKSKRVVKRIRFLAQESGTKKEKKKLVSPPPSCYFDNPETEEKKIDRPRTPMFGSSNCHESFKETKNYPITGNIKDTLKVKKDSFIFTGKYYEYIDVMMK